MTSGKIHATDHTNASRTLLYNIKEKKWDEELCSILKIPLNILPEVKSSIDDYGIVVSIPSLKGTPIYGVAGDQQAALFGQTCFSKGQIKNTYGTGGFLMMNTGDDVIDSDTGLLTTLAVKGNGEPCYALEGSIFIAGAAIQWLRDGLKILEKASDSEKMALSIEDNKGVYLVPAFVGLGAPHWNMQTRGVICGLTRGVDRNCIVRAALESMAYQSYDVVTAMEQDTGAKIGKIAVDGGAVANNFLMQFQSDILNKPVLRPVIIESTSLGAAYMAGLKAGMWKDQAELTQLKKYEKEFLPSMDKGERKKLLSGWQKALSRTLL